MKKIFAIIVIFLAAVLSNAQTKLSLEFCYEKACENYPLIKQKKYIEQSGEFNVSNVWKGYFPQVTLSGQATYQSDVTSLPISLPGIKIESLDKNQYKAVADVTQTIYDGGIMSAQSDIHKSIAEVEDGKIEIEIIKLKERITQIYFGILLLNEQLVQTELVEKDLKSSLNKLEALFKNGAAIKSNLDILKAELLKTKQRDLVIKSSRKSYVDMLGLLTNQNLEESQEFEIPVNSDFSFSEEINRPELNLYSSQEKLTQHQNQLTTAKVLPKLNLFFQGGYGKPTLNMLKNEFDWFYIAGAKLSLPLSNLYTFGSEKEINALNKKSIDAQKETFILNTKLNLVQHKNEIAKLKQLIESDSEIISIRTSVKEAAKAQLENGIITSNDFIRELNAEDQAKQNLAIHNIQLLLAQQNYKLTSGN
jgi:outer membrane protein TolC